MLSFHSQSVKQEEEEEETKMDGRGGEGGGESVHCSVFAPPPPPPSHSAYRIKQSACVLSRGGIIAGLRQSSLHLACANLLFLRQKSVVVEGGSLSFRYCVTASSLCRKLTVNCSSIKSAIFLSTVDSKGTPGILQCANQVSTTTEVSFLLSPR